MPRAVRLASSMPRAVRLASEAQRAVPAGVLRSDAHAAVELTASPVKAGTAEELTASVQPQASTPRYSAACTILTLMPGSLLTTIDQGVMDVCLVTIAKELATPLHRAQWVVLVYLLLSASTQVAAGRLGDRYSKPRVYRVGLLIFIGSSTSCAFAPSIEALIALRAVQGLGQSLMSSNSLAMVKFFTRPEQTSVAIGYSHSMIGLGMSLGPPLGGLLTSAFGWRSVFLINLPTGAPSNRCSPLVHTQPTWSACLEEIRICPHPNPRLVLPPPRPSLQSQPSTCRRARDGARLHPPRHARVRRRVA